MPSASSSRRSKQTKSTDPKKLAEYLHKDFKNFPGITGPILGFDEKGDRNGTIHKAYVINDKGEFVPVPEAAVNCSEWAEMGGARRICQPRPLSHSPTLPLRLLPSTLPRGTTWNYSSRT